MWFLCAIIAYFFLALVAVLDKIILTKSVGKPVVYTFYSTVFLIAVFAVWPFGVALPTPGDILRGCVSGFSFGFAMWTMFKAIKTGEASHINPFLGAVITLSTYGFSAMILGERLTATQGAGVVLLAFASLLLSFEKSKKYHGFHVGFLWAILSGVLFALSNVFSKYFYEHYDFITGIVWTRGTAGLFGLCLLLFPSVWRSFHPKKKRLSLKTFGKKHAFGIVFANKLFSVIGIILAHYAFSLGSVTIVNALSGLEYVMVFICIYSLTKLRPKILKEYFTEQELTIEIVAILLVAVGSVFFVL